MKKLTTILLAAFLMMASLPVLAQKDSTVHAQIDSSFIQQKIDSLIAHYGQTGVTVPVLNIHTTWFILILFILGLLELITRAIPGVAPFSTTLGKIIKYIHEHWNNK